MRITMSPQDYATAFRLLSETSRHPENVAEAIRQRVVPDLPEKPSLLDVGAGPGAIAARLAPYFDTMTLIEPNDAQLGSSAPAGAEIVRDVFERFESPRRYDLVLCSHVLYHVPLAEWGGFIDRLLAFVRPGGHCAIVLGAPRGQNYELHLDFTSMVIDSSVLLKTLRDKQLAFDVVGSHNAYTAATLEEMVTLCRFFVLADCYSAEQLAALTEPEARALDDKIRGHAARCLTEDGTYRLRQEDDTILLRRA
ncbi:class I SAM-dependent methyltransferase [Sorangium sp. So ce131]|uniref:class I SAM-dependent methyltransferase n=1 Tax=Sorangium sp. So ce131 TaxID=3133282 RepID=UPI003F5F3D82